MPNPGRARASRLRGAKEGMRGAGAPAFAGMGSAGWDAGQAGDGGGSDGVQAAVALRVGAPSLTLDRVHSRRIADRDGVKPRAEPARRWRERAETAATLIYRGDSVGIIMHTCAKPVRRSGVSLARLPPMRALPWGFEQTGRSPLAPSALLCYNLLVP